MKNVSSCGEGANVPLVLSLLNPPSYRATPGGDFLTTSVLSMIVCDVLGNTYDGDHTLCAFECPSNGKQIIGHAFRLASLTSLNAHYGLCEITYANLTTAGIWTQTTTKKDIKLQNFSCAECWNVLIFVVYFILWDTNIEKLVMHILCDIGYIMLYMSCRYFVNGDVSVAICLMGFADTGIKHGSDVHLGCIWQINQAVLITRIACGELHSCVGFQISCSSGSSCSLYPANLIRNGVTI